MTESGGPPSKTPSALVVSPDYSLLHSGIPFIVLAVVIGAAKNFADPDLWLHVLAGQQMVHSGHIMLRDSYSYAAPALPWYDHEWLAQVMLGISYQWLGVIGLKLLKLVCTAVMMTAVASGLARTAASPGVQRIMLLAAATGLISQIQFRPSLFTLVMLSIVVARLAAETYAGPVRLWTLVPLFALWANLHGGCFAGLGALGIFTLFFGVREFTGAHKLVRTKRIVSVALLCALATLLNPLGWRLWETFFASASDPLMRPVISDWVPLFRFITYTWSRSAGEPLQYIVPLLLFAALPVSLIVAPGLDDAPMAAVGLVFTAGAIYSNRNVGLAIIALVPPLARHAGMAVRRREIAASKIGPNNAGPNPMLVMTAAVLIALSGGAFSNRLKTWEPVPWGAVAFMKAHGLHGNILNNIDWGEYLIWHLAPQSKVFIDGRYQLVYPGSLRRQYLAFLYGWPGGEKVLDSYPHDFVLARPDSPSYLIAARNPRWKLIYRDAVSALFSRSGAPLQLGDGKVTGDGAADRYFP